MVKYQKSWLVHYYIFCSFFRSKTGAGDVEVLKYPFNIGRDLLHTIFESHNTTGAPWPQNINFFGKSIFLKVLCDNIFMKWLFLDV